MTTSQLLKKWDHPILNTKCQSLWSSSTPLHTKKFQLAVKLQLSVLLRKKRSPQAIKKPTITSVQQAPVQQAFQQVLSLTQHPRTSKLLSHLDLSHLNLHWSNQIAVIKKNTSQQTKTLLQKTSLETEIWKIAQPQFKLSSRKFSTKKMANLEVAHTNKELKTMSSSRLWVNYTLQNKRNTKAQLKD